MTEEEFVDSFLKAVRPGLDRMSIAAEGVVLFEMVAAWLRRHPAAHFDVVLDWFVANIKRARQFEDLREYAASLNGVAAPARTP